MSFDELKEVKDFFKENNIIRLQDISSLFTLVVTAPVIGITIQGVLIAFLHLFKLSFNDRARTKVYKFVKNILRKKNELDIPEDKAEKILNHIKRMPPDAVFVLLYHTSAPVNLIEWARRRRSYGYLGWNWAIAAFSGIFIGFIIKFMIVDPPDMDYIRPLILLSTLFWIGGAIWLSKKMKLDVDSMEFVWACASLHPNLKSELYKEKKENNHKAGVV
jgi:hypothetical protein